MVASKSAKQIATELGENAGRYLLLDVREPEERELAYIEPSLHIPMAEIADRLGEIPRDRDVVVYCHHGSRSIAVVSYLESEGFERLTNLTGGIDAWSRTVDDRVARY
ncbi:MAG: sulfurtransferase [Thermoplasmata archaeon]|nr:sulfurtransferase [Thermoplasmata archaeon]